MTSGRRQGVRLFLVVIASALAFGPLAPAAAAPEDAKTYPDVRYSTDVPVSPTQTESQSKLWYYADAWWGLFVEPTGRTVRVHELMPDHTWRPTGAVIGTDVTQVGDALRDGDDVHVVSRLGDDTLQYVRLTFDPAAGEYRAGTARVATAGGGNAAPTVAKDSTGRLWVGYANGRFVALTYSDDGVTWADTVPMATLGDGSNPEVAAVIAFDDQVGLMWSDQTHGSFAFATHRDGDPPKAWTREKALTGEGEIDNHISIVGVPGDAGTTLYAAVKTSKGDKGEPENDVLIKILVRSPAGTWSQVPAATVADRLTDPLLQVDPRRQILYMFAATRKGDIVEKKASLDGLTFDEGIGDLFVLGNGGQLFDPTGTKDAIDRESGLVIVAHDAVRKTYRHAEAPVGSAVRPAAPDDKTAPSTPGALQVRTVSPTSVVLSWAPSTDGDRWAPAVNGPPVGRYVVARQGADVATLDSTSFRDSPRTAPASHGLTVRYEVRAVDEAGNQSPAAVLVVTLPAAPSRMPLVAGLGVLGLAAVAAAYRLQKLRVFNRAMASGQPAESAEPLPELAGTAR
jgi:hypothetical protein